MMEHWTITYIQQKRGKVWQTGCPKCKEDLHISYSSQYVRIRCGNRIIQYICEECFKKEFGGL